MLKHPKEKGRRHELHVAEIIKGYGFDVGRMPGSGAFTFLKGDLRDVGPRKFPFFVECKNSEKTEFIPWYKKANSESGVLPPIIVWTRNDEDVYAFILFTDFMKVLTSKPLAKEVIAKKQTHKKLTLDETANLQFSKKQQVRKKNGS